MKASSIKDSLEQRRADVQRLSQGIWCAISLLRYHTQKLDPVANKRLGCLLVGCWRSVIPIFIFQCDITKDFVIGFEVSNLVFTSSHFQTPSIHIPSPKSILNWLGVSLASGTGPPMTSVTYELVIVGARKAFAQVFVYQWPKTSASV